MTTATKEWNAGDGCRFTDSHDGLEHSGTVLYASRNYDGRPDMLCVEDRDSHAQVFLYADRVRP